MDRPDFTTAVIDPRKLTDYLLALDHPQGGAKAGFFNACGFSVAQPAVLAEALRLQAVFGTPVSIHTGFGVKYTVDSPLIGFDGRVRMIRSVWIAEGEGRPLRFVTAYPLEARRGAR